VDDGLTFYGADGRDHSYPLPKVGLFHYDAIEDITLVRNSEDQLLLCRGFERKETYVRRGQRFVLSNISLRNGAGIMLHYEHRHGEHSLLSDLITYQENDFTKVHLHLGTMIDDHGRFIGLWQIVDGEPLRQLCAYQYDAYGDLIQAQDENGAVWSYQFEHHLITRYTDRTGRGMNLQWDGQSAKAKAIREWADDGSFDTRLEWDENIRLTYVTDALGNETWHYYDILSTTSCANTPAPTTTTTNAATRSSAGTTANAATCAGTCLIDWCISKTRASALISPTTHWDAACTKTPARTTNSVQKQAPSGTETNTPANSANSAAASPCTAGTATTSRGKAARRRAMAKRVARCTTSSNRALLSLWHRLCGTRRSI
jgi:hypothetical protein